MIKSPNSPIQFSLLPPFSFLPNYYYYYYYYYYYSASAPMASAGDGTAPNEPAGSGGKFRKKPLRRSIPATPYSRPPTAVRNNNPSMFKKLVDPASRLISAGAHRLFDVFRRSLPPKSLGPTEVNEDPQNDLQNEGEDGNAASNSAATGISELEQMLQQKTFTRSEIQRLTSVLHSKTTESPFDDSQEKHGDKRVTFHAAISTPIVTSGDEIGSPAELAKSYMGSRPTNQAPRQGLELLPRTSFTPVAQKTANSLRNLENGFATPRSRGRSAMYTMARSPYFKSPSTSSQQGIKSDYAHDAALTSFQGQEGRTALKRRSSVLDDDIGSGNSLRKIRQKANLISQREKKELGYTGFQQPGGAGRNLLLADKPEPTVSNYASVPAKATQTATKILQLCDKPSPKESNSVSTNELRLDMLHGQALKSLEKVESPKFVSGVRDIQKPVVPESTFKSKDKTEESNVRKSPVSNDMFTSVNDDVRDTLKDKAPVVQFTELPSKVTEVVQIKHAFQMSAPEDSFEMDDDDDDVHENGTTSAADIIKTPTVPEVSKASELVEYDKPVFDEVSKVPEQIKLKEGENDTNKGSVSDQGLGFKIPVSSSSSPPVTITQSSVFTKSTSQIEKVDPVKVSPFSFAANEVSEFKSNAGSDAKAKEVVPISVFNSVAKNDAAKVSVSNKDENGVLNGKSESLFPAASAATSSDGIFSFGTSTKNISTPDTTPASNPPTFPSLATFSASASTAATLTTTTTTPAVNFSTSVSPQVFSFGSAASTAPSTSVAGGNTTTSSSSPFAITTFATTTTTESGLFGFSSPATATSTTNTTAGSSLFGFSSLAATTAAAGSGLFGASSSEAATSTTTTTTGSGLFGVGSPAATATGSGLFGASSLAAATATGSGLFGASSSAAATTTGSGLFGARSSAAATTGSGLFGASSSAAATTTRSGLFGASFPAATTSTNGSGPFGFSSAAAATSTTAATTGSGLFGFSSPAATTSTANTSTASGLFGFSSSAGPTSTTTASTAGGLFGFSSPAPPTSTATATTVSGLFGASSSTAATSTTIPFGFGSAAAATSTTTPFGFGSSAAATSTTTPSPFGFSSTAAATTTTTTTGGVPFAFNSSAAAPSTTSSQSPGSFFNISNGFQASTNASSISTLFGSSAPAFGSSTFGTSSLGPTSETKSGNTTSIFGSTWQQPQTSSAFGSTFTTPSSSVFSFGASSTPTPSFMTAGASNSSFGGPSVFGNSTPVFGAVNNNNNNSDQMSMEDSMAEDSMQTHSPVSPFGQAPASSPGFMFGSATPTPAPAPVSFSFGGQPNQAPPPQNPFQSSSVEFNAGGGSFSLGSGGDKSNRRIVRVMKGKNRKK
ncbi:uncharacterized protein LOC143566056 isoform X2 [Bidens hawaiensis]|uniref:uncharacterized protein LOC143566056 isoform X2 n=1 Tax=Bidens hawaiensis TaxID=980011 RepID=UPI004049EB11